MDIRYPETLRYAAGELTRIAGIVSLCTALSVTLNVDPTLAKDPDDLYDIRIEHGVGTITGSNPRSVLMGVYAYFHAAGCRYLKPGPAGEYLPPCDLASFDCVLRKAAAYAFRGQCIEGAVSFENVRDMIDWLPKIGMNLFMLEQVVPFNYMSRWYKHEASTVKQDEHPTYEQIEGYTRMLEREIKLRGLQLHALGHGYLFEPYGVHYKTWADKYTLSDEAIADAAMVDGKRGLYHGSPNFTQLCTSRPEVRAKMVRFLADYLERLPYIDFLHVWLSDAAGNCCECDECRKHHPCDLYVTLLNELDAELTARGISTRVVFIMYTDTLWAPEYARFEHPERFVFTTALARDHGKSYDDTPYDGAIPVWKRNDNHIKASFPLMMKFYEAWRKVFSGPAFAFEYPFYTDHFNDPGCMEVARVVWEDARSIRAFGFDGIMSDQTQRACFPNGLAQAIYATTLFDPSTDFDAFVDDYLTAAYGDDARRVRTYLETLTALFDPKTLRARLTETEQDTTGSAADVKTWRNNPEAAARFAEVSGVVDAFREVLARHTDERNPARHDMWRLLELHADYCVKLAQMLGYGARGDIDGARARFNEMMDWLSHVEDALQPEFDLVLFHKEFGRKLQ